MRNKENYSRNQCTLLIRVDGDELEIPVNFGLSAHEIKAIYPYLAKLANTKITNPALKFADDSGAGRYTDLSEEEYAQLVEAYHRQAEYWYQKPEASLLDLAVRFALDIQFKGIQEIQDAFSTVTPFEHIKTSNIVSKEEAHAILKDAGMEADSNTEADVDEKDVEMGVAGNVPVDIYGTGDAGDFLSKELDDMNASRAEDRFEKIVNGETEDKQPEIPDRYKSNYKARGFEEGQIGENGLLDLYATNGSSDAIFGDAPDDGSTAEELLGDKPAAAPAVPEDDPDDDDGEYGEENEVPQDESLLDQDIEEPELDNVDDDSEE